MLNDIALSTDRPSALALAVKARTALAEWPKQHHGYRQDDVREIVTLIDEAIAGLRAAGGATTFDLALVASAPTVPLEPVLGMPTPARAARPGAAARRRWRPTPPSGWRCCRARWRWSTKTAPASRGTELDGDARLARDAHPQRSARSTSGTPGWREQLTTRAGRRSGAGAHHRRREGP